MSYLDLLDEATLFRNLRVIDEELSSRTRAAGCARCGAALHAAHYERKPRGERIEIPPECRTRLALCCGSCRIRTLPPSVLYWGRRVYWASVLVLVTGAAQGLCSSTMSELSTRFGVARRTIKRWLAFFAVSFPGSAVWQRLRGYIAPTVSNDLLPRRLITLWFDGRSAAVERFTQLQTLLVTGP